MKNIFITIIFLLFTLFILGRIIAYAIYEIKGENNLFGGVCVIAFSTISVAFCNVMLWIN